MRPQAVVQAERLFVASALLTLVAAALDWTALVEAGGLALAAVVVGFFTGLFVVLILLATRRGSPVARGILLVLTVLSTASMLWQIGTGQVGLGWPAVVNTVQMLLMVVATVLLFRPVASAWFRDRQASREDEDEDDGAVLLGEEA